MIYFDFSSVEVFTAGAVGEPGRRTFFLQARSGDQDVSIKCEKQQVAAIAQYLRRALQDLPGTDPLESSNPLQMAIPVDPVFTLGSIGLGYDPATNLFVVQLDELLPDDLDDDDDDELASEAGDVDDADDADDRGRVRIFVTPGQARGFCDRADELMSSGRPDCIFCGRPINPDGHICPRMN